MPNDVNRANVAKALQIGVGVIVVLFLLDRGFSGRAIGGPPVEIGDFEGGRQFKRDGFRIREG